MCFSAVASFGAGVVLTTIGITSLKKVQTPSQIAFAAIPLIFAVQQISEGFVWLSLTNTNFSSLNQAMTYVFLFFAQVAWPIWVPFAIMKLEKNEGRKKILKVIVGIGAFVSLYLLFCLINFYVESQILGYHIYYLQDYPEDIKLYHSSFYIIATVLPPFFSTVKKMPILGLGILLSCIITIIFYEQYIISVWCFFAAIISITIYGILWLMAKPSEIAVDPIAK